MTVASVNTSRPARARSPCPPHRSGPGGEPWRTSPGAAHPGRCRRMSTPCWAVGAAVATHGPERVLDDVGQGAWHCTVRLVYGVLHGLVLPVWRGDETYAPPGALTPRRGRCRNRLG